MAALIQEAAVYLALFGCTQDQVYTCHHQRLVEFGMIPTASATQTVGPALLDSYEVV